MSTHLTTDAMKAFVRQHFEDFVNNKRAEVIRQNMTPDFYDHDGPGGQPYGVEGDENMMRGMYEPTLGSHDRGDDRRGRPGGVPEQMALERREKRRAHGVPRLRGVAFRGRQDRGAMGHLGHAPARRVHIMR